MTKTELIDVVSNRAEISKTKAGDIVDAMFEEIKESLKSGERIELRGFGSFSIRNYASKTGRNPASGATLSIGKKRSVHFKPGKELRERVKDHFDAE